jgi:hypothetical protein
VEHQTVFPLTAIPVTYEGLVIWVTPPVVLRAEQEPKNNPRMSAAASNPFKRITCPSSLYNRCRLIIFVIFGRMCDIYDKDYI